MARRETERICFAEPAKSWEEALPLGNGKLGAMLFSEVGEEHIQLNEESVWYGGLMDRNNPDAKTHLQEFRDDIFEGRLREATELAFHAFSGTPQSMRQYQNLGDLTIYGDGGKAEAYERSLDLSEAVHRVSYCIESYTYTREQFISAPDNVLVMRYVTDAPKGLNMTPLMTRARYYDYSGKADENTIMLGGNLAKEGYDFCMMLRAKTVGGCCKVLGERLVIEGAKEVLFFFTAGTTFKEGKLKERLISCLNAAEKQGFECLRKRHVADYTSYYDRMKLELGVTSASEQNEHKEECGRQTAGEKVAGLSETNQVERPEFAERYFNFGRYLMICSSRPGTLPITLQGLWNKDYLPPWDSKYTININTEMNYWPAESCNLSECHLPLFEHLERMLPNGQRTAEVMYGCSGFVAHHNTDIWGDTAVQDIWEPASYWVMGAAWLCTHQWTHYIYTKDTEFLRRAYPVMREAAKFFLDFLVEKDGKLLTCPSVSPENTYILPSGQQGCLTAGATMDNQILRDLMTQCIRAAELLGIEEPLAKEFAAVIAKLPENQIGKYGQLMEWAEDYEEAEPGHRHISHLYGLHPSHQITPDGTPELAKAAEITLQRRLANGGGHTGWSRAWIINMYARLFKGQEAYENLVQLFKKSTLPNLFDNHPPFQIDGNFGAIAGMVEMLVQSSEERTRLLPALPAAWNSGRVSGLKIVGGAVLDMAWDNGQLTECTVTAGQALTTKLVYRDLVKTVVLAEGEKYIWA